MISQKKHKMLSRLIAFTFAFNTIAPIAFASEEATTATTATASSGLSLNSVSNDILTRMASTASSNFKSRNLNISDSEINTLMSIPLSTNEEESYLTQEEKDYNNLQLLIAKGYNSKEKRQAALDAIEEVEQATAKDASVGGLTEAEKYMKQLLENYDEIESRANISSGVSSAITPTDSAMAAYKTILKIAKAERLACRNDATANKAKLAEGKTLEEGTNTDPDKCELSAKGKEAAQMLTAISNQQVNQTTDAKKTTTGTTSTTSSTGERQCTNSATPLVALNDNTRCCTSQQPYFNSTTGKCVASLGATNSSNNNNDDDDDDSSALLALLMQQQQQNKNDAKDGSNTSVGQSQGQNDGGNSVTYSHRYNQNQKSSSLKLGRDANEIIMKRIGDIKVEFNEPTVDEQGTHIHISDSNTEYKMTVTIEEKENYSYNVKTENEQRPLTLNIKATQYVSADDNSNLSPYTISYKNIPSGQAVNIVYPTNMTPIKGQHFVKAERSDYVAIVTITDGKYESAPFYIKYKIVNNQNKILSDGKDQTAKKSIISLQGKAYETDEIGTADLFVSGARYENGICKVSVSGNMVTDTETHDAYEASQYNITSLNETDCNKLNEDAQDKEVRLISNNARIAERNDDYSVTLDTSGNAIPGFIVNGEDQDIATYLPSSVGGEEISFNKNDVKGGYAMALGNTVNGGAIALTGSNLTINGRYATNEEYRTFFKDSNLTDVAYVSVEYDENNKAVSVIAFDKEDNTLATRTLEDINHETRGGLIRKSPLTRDTIDSVIALGKKFGNEGRKIVAPNEIVTVIEKVKGVITSTGNSENNNRLNSSTTPVEKNTPVITPSNTSNSGSNSGSNITPDNQVTSLLQSFNSSRGETNNTKEYKK